MRAILLLAATLSIAAPISAAPGLAQTSAQGPAASSASEPADHAARLDTLFGDLRREADAAKAEAIANQIQAEWLQSGSATTDLLMQRAAKAVAEKNLAAALDLLDQAIVLQPAFPEAWNRRATVHYAEDRYRLAMAVHENDTSAIEP